MTADAISRVFPSNSKAAAEMRHRSVRNDVMNNDRPIDAHQPTPLMSCRNGVSTSMYATRPMNTMTVSATFHMTLFGNYEIDIVSGGIKATVVIHVVLVFPHRLEAMHRERVEKELLV